MNYESLLEEWPLVCPLVHDISIQIHLQQRARLSWQELLRGKRPLPGSRPVGLLPSLRSCDLIKAQAEGVDQKVRSAGQAIAFRHLQRDVVEHKLIPAIVSRESVRDGQLTTSLPPPFSNNRARADGVAAPPTLHTGLSRKDF